MRLRPVTLRIPPQPSKRQIGSLRRRGAPLASHEVRLRSFDQPANPIWCSQFLAFQSRFVFTSEGEVKVVPKAQRALAQLRSALFLVLCP